MPSAAQKICRVPGCGKTFCKIHSSAEKQFDKERGSASARGYGRTWQKLAKMVLARDPLCKIAKLCVTRAIGRNGAILLLPAPSSVADHVVPKSKGGKDELSNLQGACKRCHDHKTRTEDSALARRDAKKFGRLGGSNLP
jgi:5-methylcytosine-specific restriction protein A